MMRAPSSYIALEVDREGLSAWTLTGREQDDRVQITHGRIVGWVHKTVLAPVLFPSALVFSVPCHGCHTVIKVQVPAFERIEPPFFCRICQIMEDQAQSGVQTIGPKR